MPIQLLSPHKSPKRATVTQQEFMIVKVQRVAYVHVTSPSGAAQKGLI